MSKELETNLNITMEKSFLHTKNIGFNWHKSWNLPIIKVSLDVIYSHKILFIGYFLDF